MVLPASVVHLVRTALERIGADAAVLGRRSDAVGVEGRVGTAAERCLRVAVGSTGVEVEDPAGGGEDDAVGELKSACGR
jgi:hypothetical protein